MDSVTSAPKPGQPLGEADFDLTCLNGFGDGLNSYAHSAAWFNDKLYVGTTRGNLAGLRLAGRRKGIQPWPIECPADIYDLDRRAQIWEYTVETDTWQMVFRSPTVHGSNGRDDVPSYIGLRGMAVIQTENDPHPCLYVSAWSPHTAHSPDILRSEDGRHFAPIARPPFGPAVRTCRTLKQFSGRVHLSPTGSGTAKGFTQDLSSEAIIYANHDLTSNDWQAASPEGFGNLDNATVFEMAKFDGHLYGGTVNPSAGSELWKTRGGDSLPYTWEKVYDRGAGRGQLNEATTALCEFNGALYAGCGIINGGYHYAAGIGPASAELIRVWPDNSWDLIVGEPRMTDQGPKYPLSGIGPGFDSIFNGYIWRMCVHDGWLYVGTFSWANLLPYILIPSWPPDVQTLIEHWGEDALVQNHGGAEIWRSADGINFEPVTRNGFGNHFNWGFRNLVSTSHGLFITTANPFGPKVAVKRHGEWVYEPNPRGGCEVWLGRKQSA